MRWRRCRDPKTGEPSAYAIESEDGKVRVSKAVIPGGVRYVRWQRVGTTWSIVGVYESAEDAKQQQRPIGGR